MTTLCVLHLETSVEWMEGGLLVMLRTALRHSRVVGIAQGRISMQ